MAALGFHMLAFVNLDNQNMNVLFSLLHQSLNQILRMKSYFKRQLNFEDSQLDRLISNQQVSAFKFVPINNRQPFEFLLNDSNVGSGAPPAGSLKIIL